MGSRVLTFRLGDEDRARLQSLLARENTTLGEWIRRRIAEAGAPAGAPAHVSAQARAGDDEATALRVETARLREETTRAVTLAPEAMAALEHLFRQCVRLWPEYQTCGGHGFSRWLSDSAISFWVLNAHTLGLDLGRHADGALSATPMLRALVCRVVQDLVLPKRRC
ncbi:MAG: hypothetical protein ACM3X3_09795 [Betaproteobacteria bacterium]